ncbi:MAG: hypothetical protein Q9197_001363 [Variospora fuerteventurae]
MLPHTERKRPSRSSLPELFGAAAALTTSLTSAPATAPPSSRLKPNSSISDTQITEKAPTTPSESPNPIKSFVDATKTPPLSPTPDTRTAIPGPSPLHNSRHLWLNRLAPTYDPAQAYSIRHHGCSVAVHNLSTQVGSFWSRGSSMSVSDSANWSCFPQPGHLASRLESYFHRIRPKALKYKLVLAKPDQIAQ